MSETVKTRREPTEEYPFIFSAKRKSWVCLHHGEQDKSAWIPCWQCCGDGGFDLYEEDPCYYDEDEWEVCDICHGKEGFHVCPECNKDNPDAEF